MLLQDFGNRADECMSMATRTSSLRDRDFLIEMARAWYGLGRDDEAGTAESVKHPN